MVLARRDGGAAAGRTPTRPTDRGSQALEFAMVLPLFGLLLALLAQTGLLLGDVVVVQGLAREVARTAAVEGEAAARELAADLAARRELRTEVLRTGGLVEARVRLRSEVFAALGLDIWLPARVRMRPEGAAGHGPDAAPRGGDPAMGDGDDGG